MKRFLFTTSLIVLCSASVAQTTYRTSPNGFTTTEGYQSAYIFGEYNSPRLMFFDGEMRSSVMIMKEIAVRHDNRSYNTRNGMGRTWSNVTLDISYGDITKISHTFSANPTSTPARVFSGSVTFPTMSGYPTNNPASWDLKFPFSSSWINNGSADICLDFDFNGGVLANNNRWSTGWYVTYYTDAPNIGDHSTGRYTVFGTGCKDTTATFPGQAAVFTDVYSKNYATAAYQNKYKIATRTRNTAPGKPVVHAVSLFGNPTGASFPGVACEKVFVDMSKPFFVFFLTAGAAPRAEARIDYPLIPFNKSLAGIPFWVQGAWDDPGASGALKFTYAEKTLLPPMPAILKRRMIYQPDTSKKGTMAKTTQGSLTSPFSQATHNPIFRYAQ